MRPLHPVSGASGVRRKPEFRLRFRPRFCTKFLRGQTTTFTDTIGADAMAVESARIGEPFAARGALAARAGERGAAHGVIALARLRPAASRWSAASTKPAGGASVWRA